MAAALAVILTAGSLHAAEYHVSPSGRDFNRGDKSRPFKTISAAARVARPGDVVTVHGGVYRERVNPARGGTSDTRRIVYRAAEGQKVEIKGSEIIKSWEKAQDGVWKVTLPNSFFGDFSPYTDVIKGEWHRNRGHPRHTGTVYVNGDWMDEARSLEQVVPPGKRAVGPRTDSRDVVLGGKTAGYEGTAIAGTDEDTLYQTCRYDLRGYRLAVPNGMCRVTLKFCEPHFAARAQRVFDVKLQGKTVLSGFDIFAEVGRFTAHDETFEGVEVTDGQLKIDIINRVSLACISGIVVQRGADSRGINCGGPGWKGYRPDPASRGGRDAVVSGRPLWKAEVDETNTTIWAQFNDIDPNRELVEINVRQSVFYPDKPGRNYITVRGFTMRHAATPWSGAMSEQVGLIGTHWSKGWVIEDNVISHSMNTGITLGRYDLGRFGIAMPAATAPGFVKSCELALEHGWSKAKIGSHVVRNNRISHCEKNGLHGSLGGIFSTIEGNTIHDIATRGWIGGADVAGLKLLASNDVTIRNNHFYRCGGFGGVWLDWMAQGTRFPGNWICTFL
ncbi:MAG: malectin domain-containing carbohydrate-binding protein [Planctomycetota bacterium]